MESQAWHRNTLLAFFDLDAYPTGDEIFAFILFAEKARRDCRAVSLHFVFVPEGDPDSDGARPMKGVGADPKTYRLSQSVMMMPSIMGYTICGSRSEAFRIFSTWDGPIFPSDYRISGPDDARNGRHCESDTIYRLIDEARARRDVLPALAIPRQAVEYVSGWLGKIEAGRSLVTVTLANAVDAEVGGEIAHHRVQFVEQIDVSRYLVVFVADGGLAVESLPEGLRRVPIFPGADAFSPLRLAIYRRAHFNFVEAAAADGLCRADDGIRCAYFGRRVAGRSGAVDRLFQIDGYDADAILDAFHQVEAAKASVSVADGSKRASTAEVMSIDAFFTRALEFHKAGRTENAIKIYSAILKANPQHAGAHGMLGVMAVVLGEAERALPLLMRAVALDGGEPAHHYNLGSVQMILGREDEAIASYRTALSAKRDLYEAWEKLASIYDRTGHLEEAAACYLEAAKGPKWSPQTLFRGARCLARLDRHEEAAQLYRNACIFYLNRMDDENFASAMGGFFWRVPYLPRNASFLSD